MSEPSPEKKPDRWAQRGFFASFGYALNGVLRTVATQRNMKMHWVSEEEVMLVGMALELDVDHARRKQARANHSATHILHEALRQVLGEHVAQKGSLVAPDRLRFDFTHPKPLTEEELARVETLANEIVQDNAPVETRVMAQDDAIRSGARALFGEKYGDEVRVVSMGRPDVGVAHPFSVELCGGTHVARTGDIGLIAIVGEGAVASGVRRIEAITGEAELFENAADGAVVIDCGEQDVFNGYEVVLEPFSFVLGFCKELGKSCGYVDLVGSGGRS